MRKRKTGLKPGGSPTQPDDSPAQPSWLPGGPLWDHFSSGFQYTIQEVLAPAYRQFVLEADDPIERSVGMTVVQLLWLEAWNHERLMESLAPANPYLLDVTEPQDQIPRHLELAAAKCHATELLAKLRMVRKTLETRLPVPSPPILLARELVPDRQPQPGLAPLPPEWEGEPRS